MSKNKKQKKRKAPPPQTNNCPNLTRPLLLDEEGADLLVYLMNAYDPKHWIAKSLAFILRQFADRALQLKELEMRIRTNSFWENERNEPARVIKKRLKDLKAGKKVKEKEVVDEIACLPPEEIIKLLNQPKKASDEDMSLERDSHGRLPD